MSRTALIHSAQEKIVPIKDAKVENAILSRKGGQVPLASLLPHIHQNNNKHMPLYAALLNLNLDYKNTY